MLSQQEKRYEPSVWFSFFYSLDSWLSWFNTIYLSPSAHFNSRFLFIKDLLLFIWSVMQSVRYLILTWRKGKQMSHNAFSGRHNCEPCFLLCPLRQKNWQNVDRSLKRTGKLYSAHHLNPCSQKLKKFSTAVHFSIKFPLLFFTSHQHSLSH